MKYIEVGIDEAKYEKALAVVADFVSWPNGEPPTPQLEAAFQEWLCGKVQEAVDRVIDTPCSAGEAGFLIKRIYLKRIEEQDFQRRFEVKWQRQLQGEQQRQQGEQELEVGVASCL